MIMSIAVVLEKSNPFFKQMVLFSPPTLFFFDQTEKKWITCGILEVAG